MPASRIVQKLSAQMELECLSSQRYLYLSKWCAVRNMSILSSFLKAQAQESVTLITHMSHYLTRTGQPPNIGDIILPPHNCYSPDELFQQTLEDLRTRLTSLSYLNRLARESGDYATLSFLQRLFSQYRQERDRLIAFQQDVTHDSPTS